MTTTAQRETMATAIDLLVARRARVGYLQRRPMQTTRIATVAQLASALAQGVECDCSESVTMLCHVAGVDSPSGPRFPYAAGWGNTQTMYDFLPHYSKPSAAGVGALVFFGEPDRLTTQHVCMVRHPGADPVLFSHGGQGQFAAHLIPFSQEARAHVGRPVFLSIAHLG